MKSYVIDTNIIINLNRHMPRDIFEGPWQSLEILVRAGRLYMPREVLEELSVVDDECAPWQNPLRGSLSMRHQRKLPASQKFQMCIQVGFRKA